MAEEDLYDRIIDEYKRCGSVKRTAEIAGTSLVRAQRVLITEGLWSSETSEAVRELFEQGKTAQEIADELFISMKTVQAYLPYTKGFYSASNRSGDAVKSDSYRKRKQMAASNQIHVSVKEKEKNMAKIIPIPTDIYTFHDRKYAAMQLRLELMNDLDSESLQILRKYGKVEKGIIREIIVPSDISLHRLNYAIQKVFGWQNSHLHHFTVPAKVFSELTGGTWDGEEDERYSLQTGSYKEWEQYCGTYFRFPTDDLDDVYWDDDYDGSFSIKNWFRSKYNNVNEYHGDSEHFVMARIKAMDLLRDNPLIEPFYSFKDFKSGMKRSDKMSPLSKSTIRDVEFYLDGALNELLERLPLDEVIRTPFESSIPKTMLRKQMREREILFDRNSMKYNTSKNFSVHSLDAIPWIEDETPVLPITDELIYRYDYGDGWGVRITVSEAYTVRDTILEGKEKSKDISLDDRDWVDGAIVYDHSGEPVGEELRKNVAEAVYLEKLNCVYADGLSVMDDVGGISGYADFLRELHEGAPEERESARVWASEMGWTGRRIKPENML